MTLDRFNNCAAAILTTLAEVEYAPESVCYLAVGADMEEWKDIKLGLWGTALIDIDDAHRVRITDKGRELAGKINAMVAKVAS